MSQMKHKHGDIMVVEYPTADNRLVRLTERRVGRKWVIIKRECLS